MNFQVFTFQVYTLQVFTASPKQLYNMNFSNELYFTIFMFTRQVSFAVLAVVMCFVSAHAAEQPKQSETATAGDRNKRGLYASPYVASPYVASPYVASPYVASPYVASSYAASPYVASPYAASPYIAPHHPYGAVSSYATYPYVSKTFSSPYAYYPWKHDRIAPSSSYQAMANYAKNALVLHVIDCSICYFIYAKFIFY